MTCLLSKANKNIIKLFEFFRIGCAGIGFYLAYVHYFAKDYATALYTLIVFVVIPLTGLTGLESILFSDKAAEIKGWHVGSPYQIQSGINNIAVATTAIIILYFKWNIYAELTALFVTLIFFLLSSINHVVSFCQQKNKRIIHLLRPIFSLLLVLAALPIIFKSLA